MKKVCLVIDKMLELLMNLIVIFENYFLSGIFQYLCFRKINQKSAFILTFLLTLEAFILACFHIDEVIRLFFPMLTLFIYALYVNKFSIWHNVIYVGISFINLILGKSIIIITVTFFLDVNLNNIVGNYKVIFFMTCLSILFLSIEYFALEYFIELRTTLSKKSMIVLGAYLILVFTTICYVFHEFIYNELSWEMCCYFTIASIIVLYLAVYLTISHSKYYEKMIEQSLKLEAEEYNTRYMDLIHEKTKEYNKLQHDYKHHLNVLRNMVKDHFFQEAQTYIDDLENQKASDLIYVDHSILNYLLNDKKSYAKSLGIEIECLVVGKIVNFISDIDYSILLGNLLDNAIEETELIDGKIIELYIQFSEERVIFEVKNQTHLQNNEKILKTHKKDYQKHGYGLKNIEDVVRKYHGQDIIEIKDGYFTHMCIFYRID